jgi:uncharacterized coiled-coil protein SlyX
MAKSENHAAGASVTAKALGLLPSSVRRDFQELRDMQLCIPDGGQYVLTQAGRELAKKHLMLPQCEVRRTAHVDRADPREKTSTKVAIETERPVLTLHGKARRSEDNTTVLSPWLGYLSFRSWLSGLPPTTARTYGYWVARYLSFVRQQPGYENRTPDQLTDKQRLTKGDAAHMYDQWHDLVKPFIDSLGHLSKKTRRSAVRAIKSFYKESEAAFPSDVSIKIKGDPNRGKVKAKLNVERLRIVIAGGSPLEKSMFIIGFQAFLGREEFEHVNKNCAEQIRSQLERYHVGEPNFDPEQVPHDILVRLDLPGRKLDPEDEVPFYTFFFKDGVIALHEYLVHQRRKLVPGSAIWLNNWGNAISGQGYSDAFLARVRSMGWVPCAKGQGSGARYGYNVHEMRDVARGRVQRAHKLGFDMQVAKFCMGHVRQLDPNMYNKFYDTEPDYVVEQMKLVAPLLNILSISDPAAAIEQHGTVKKLEETVAEQRDQIAVLRRDLAETKKRQEALENELRMAKSRLDDFSQLVSGVFKSKEPALQTEKCP